MRIVRPGVKSHGSGVTKPSLPLRALNFVATVFTPSTWRYHRDKKNLWGQPFILNVYRRLKFKTAPTQVKLLKLDRHPNLLLQ
jgi:hypothetical protein